MVAARPFHAYEAWLGLTGVETPSSHYQLLGLPALETDAAAIAVAVSLQQAKLAQADIGPRAAVAARIAAELRLASQCLLHASSKAEYDRRLRGEPTTRQRWRVACRKKSAPQPVAHAAQTARLAETVALQGVADLASVSLDAVGAAR